MLQDEFLDKLNKHLVHASVEYGVMINDTMVERAECTAIEILTDSQAYMIITYDGKHYRQNGYYQHTRNGTHIIFNEQEWYEVKPVTRVIYEYS